MSYKSPNKALQTELDRLSNMSTDDIWTELRQAGIEMNLSVFTKICTRHHAISAVVKRLDAKKDTSQAFLFAATRILWDRLCTELFLWEDFAGLIAKGIRQIQQNERPEGVATWLLAWHELRTFAIEQGIRDISMLDIQAPQNLLREELFRWVQDVEMELVNQVDEHPELAKSLLDYTVSYRETLPKSATPILLNMRSAEATALFILGRSAAGDEIYEEICQTYADDAWTFIDWGDEYSPVYHHNASLVNTKKAKQIYERGLQTATEDTQVLRREFSPSKPNGGLRALFHSSQPQTALTQRTARSSGAHKILQRLPQQLAI